MCKTTTYLALFALTWSIGFRPSGCVLLGNVGIRRELEVHANLGVMGPTSDGDTEIQRDDENMAPTQSPEPSIPLDDLGSFNNTDASITSAPHENMADVFLSLSPNANSGNELQQHLEGGLLEGNGFAPEIVSEQSTPTPPVKTMPSGVGTSESGTPVEAGDLTDPENAIDSLVDDSAEQILPTASAESASDQKANFSADASLAPWGDDPPPTTPDANEEVGGARGSEDAAPTPSISPMSTMESVSTNGGAPTFSESSLLPGTVPSTAPSPIEESVAGESAITSGQEITESSPIPPDSESSELDFSAPIDTDQDVSAITVPPQASTEDEGESTLLATPETFEGEEGKENMLLQLPLNVSSTSLVDFSPNLENDIRVFLASETNSSMEQWKLVNFTRAESIEGQEIIVWLLMYQALLDIDQSQPIFPSLQESIENGELDQILRRKHSDNSLTVSMIGLPAMDVEALPKVELGETKEEPSSGELSDVDADSTEDGEEAAFSGDVSKTNPTESGAAKSLGIILGTCFSAFAGIMLVVAGIVFARKRHQHEVRDDGADAEAPSTLPSMLSSETETTMGRYHTGAPTHPRGPQELRNQSRILDWQVEHAEASGMAKHVLGHTNTRDSEPSNGVEPEAESDEYTLASTARLVL